jgi:hypothetical protein
MKTQTKNKHARASIVAKFLACTNKRPNRISVITQRGRKNYPYENAAGDADGSSAYVRAVKLYLADIRAEDAKKYGGDAGGWGTINEYTVGVIHSGEYVFCSNK